MFKKWISLSGCLALALACQGQALVRSQTLLAGARQDQAVALQGEHLELVQQANLRLPLVEQISLRTETDRFQLQRQEYLSRLSINGLREIKRQNLLNDAERLEIESRQRLLLHEALANRYAAVVEYRLSQNEAELHQRLLEVYEDKLRVLRKMAELDLDTDVEELIKVEYDRDELQLRLSAAQNRLRQLQSLLHQLTPGLPADWQLDTAQFVQPLQLERLLASSDPAAALHPELAEQASQVSRLQAEYDLEKAKGEQVLDFLQVRFQNRPGEPFNREMSVGLGVNLPFKGSSRLKSNQLKIEQHEASQELRLGQADLQQKLTEAQQALGALSQQYSQAQQQVQNSQALFTLRQAAAGANQEPLVLLRAQELLLKRELRRLDLGRDMYSRYLDVLDWSGRLSAPPLRNYLSAALEQY
ncbi:MAG: hypothetical protein IT260_10485 [Saprospiraceae bacterium]|nr:hypothetical protein [Saprospiraceae bacterium]